MWKVWLRRIGVVVLVGLLVFVFGWVPWFLAGVATSRRFQFPDREHDIVD